MPRAACSGRRRRVIVNGNVFNPRQDWAFGGIVFRDSHSCLIANSTFHAVRAPDAAILLQRCENTRVVNCTLTETTRGIVLDNSRHCHILDCSIDPPTAGGKPVTDRDGQANPTRLLKTR